MGHADRVTEKVGFLGDDKERILDARNAVVALKDDRYKTILSSLNETIENSAPLDRKMVLGAIGQLKIDMVKEIIPTKVNLKFHGEAAESLSTLVHKTNLFGSPKSVGIGTDD